MKRIIFVAVFSLSAFQFSVAGAVPDDQAVRAIIGEAANQGKDGMLAVACAIRNRDKARPGSGLKGVYGLNNKQVRLAPAWVWARARAAWIQSATQDVTAGATNWENTKAFGEPYWAKSMQKTVRIGDHQFFKP